MRELNYTVRPLEKRPVAKGRRKSNFSSNWRDTLVLLGRELNHLDAKEVVLQVDVDERHIRQDGMLRADARPNSPAVALSFVRGQKRVPYLFPCGRFDSWQDNVRAIALGLESLRRVDRYGITQQSEQYTGWQRIGGPVAPKDEFENVEDAAKFLVSVGGGDVGAVLSMHDYATKVYHRACSATHPDHFPDMADEFRRVGKAWERIRSFKGW